MGVKIKMKKCTICGADLSMGVNTDGKDNTCIYCRDIAHPVKRTYHQRIYGNLPLSYSGNNGGCGFDPERNNINDFLDT
jgi:hypothetical protein